MNTELLNHRRIERFAQLLDEASGERPSSHARTSKDAELSNLVTLGNRLPHAAPTVSIDGDKRAEIRAFLMATAERDGIGITARSVAEPAVGRARVGTVTRKAVGRAGSSVRTRVRARAAVLVGLAVGTLALSGISAASGSSNPGDALYGLKRAQENASIVVAGSPTAKGRIYLELASVRAGEAQTVHANSADLAVALNAMDAQMLSGTQLLFGAALGKDDNGALKSVTDFVTNQQRQLSDLLSAIGGPGASRSRVLQSITLLGRVQERAQSVATAIACHSSATNGSDQIGPKPLACQESATVTPSPSAPPTHPGSTGKPPSPGHRPGQAPSAGRTPTASNTATTSAGPSTASSTADLAAQVAPSATGTDDGGLLGSIGHVLGGLLSH